MGLGFGGLGLGAYKYGGSNIVKGRNGEAKGDYCTIIRGSILGPHPAVVAKRDNGADVLFARKADPKVGYHPR